MASLPLLASAAAHAMSMGAIEVSSSLGEPLRARVPITLDDGALPLNDCVRIVGPAQKHPDLAQARVALTLTGGRHFVTITTRGPVNDPMLDLSLRTDGCGVTMQKDYVLLLSPKAEDVPPPEVVLPVMPPAAAPGPARTHIEPAVSRPRPKPRAAAARPKAMAGGPRPGARRYFLALDYDHDAFARLAEQVAQNRREAYLRAAGQAVDRRGAPVARAGADQAPERAPALAGNAASAEAESRLVLQPPSEDLPMPERMGRDGVPQVGTGPTAAGTAATPGDGTAAGLPGTPVDATTSRPGRGWLQAPLAWLWLPLLLLVVLAVALLLKLRAPRSRLLDRSAPELDRMLPADLDDPLHHPLLSRNLPPVAERPSGLEAAPPAPEQSTAARAGTEATAGPEPKPAPGVPAADVAAVEYSVEAIQDEQLAVGPDESVDHIMELAEIMLAFGRSGQAMETLSQHILANPGQSVVPGLKLLDLYAQANLRREFDALAADLHRHFNVVIADWNDHVAGPGQQTGPLTLESLPHIMSRLTACWGSRECLDYLDRLLEDNRGGQRLGFSLPVVRDILLLRDILRETGSVSALQH
jgi:hypothetical protein